MNVKTFGTQKEAQTVALAPINKHATNLHYDVDYDSTHPEATIRNFVSDINDMIARFEGNKVRLFEIEDELQDIFHYIEISTYKSVPIGYKLYRKLAELRRERRACKNENDLLQPIYEYFHATEVLNRLTYVQGECSKAKEAIDNRYYTVRTDILQQWMEPEKPQEETTTVSFDPAPPCPEEDLIGVFEPGFISELEASVEEDIPEETIAIEPEPMPIIMPDKKHSTKKKKIFKQVWKAEK